MLSSTVLFSGLAGAKQTKRLTNAERHTCGHAAASGLAPHRQPEQEKRPKIQCFGVIAPSLAEPLSPAQSSAVSPSLPATLSAIALPAPGAAPFADRKARI